MKKTVRTYEATEMPPAVLCPLDDHMGLDIARALAPRGIPVYGIDTDKGIPGRYSNACHFVYCPYSEETRADDYIRFLVDFGKKLRTKAVLYPLSDRHVLLFSQHRTILQDYYSYVMPPHKTMERLTTKNGLHSVAQEYSIPAPQTYFVSESTSIHEIARRVPYPAILKPTESTYWHSPEITRLLRKGLLAGRAKVVLCQNAGELLNAFEQISVFNPHLVVQEVIPGEDSRLVYSAFYFDRASTPLGFFSGRKYRVVPTGFGSASYVRSFTDPELKELVIRSLSALRYQGLGGLEFKKDPRDGKYKLIEFNTRFGMWDGFGVRCGVDLPNISYQDALGRSVESQLEFRNDLIWVDWQRDVRACIAYWKQGQITFSQWWRSLKGKKMWAVYSKADWKPGAALSFALLRRLAARIKSLVSAIIKPDDRAFKR